MGQNEGIETKRTIKKSKFCQNDYRTPAVCICALFVLKKGKYNTYLIRVFSEFKTCFFFSLHRDIEYYVSGLRLWYANG